MNFRSHGSFSKPSHRLLIGPAGSRNMCGLKFRVFPKCIPNIEERHVLKSSENTGAAQVASACPPALPGGNHVFQRILFPKKVAWKRRRTVCPNRLKETSSRPPPPPPHKDANMLHHIVTTSMPGRERTR